MLVEASAPGKVILFGEHAVVYDKLGIAAAIDRRCEVKVRSSEFKDLIEIYSSNYKISSFYRIQELRKIGSKLEEKIGDLQFLKKIQADRLLPSFFVAYLTMKKLREFQPLKIEIYSEVPKNLGSSSSTFASVAMGICKFLKGKLSSSQIANIVYKGDTIVHLRPSGIDNRIVVYGNFIAFRKSAGFRKLKVRKFPILIVDSHEPARTSETILKVSTIIKRKKEFGEKILEELDQISKDATKALNEMDLERIGNLMYKYYYKLREFGISTKILDKIIDISLKKGALGAKPTGGWGGGCCLVLGKDLNHLKKLRDCFSKYGFYSFITYLGERGVE